MGQSLFFFVRKSMGKFFTFFWPLNCLRFLLVLLLPLRKILFAGYSSSDGRKVSVLPSVTLHRKQVAIFHYGIKNLAQVIVFFLGWFRSLDEVNSFVYRPVRMNRWSLVNQITLGLETDPGRSPGQIFVESRVFTPLLPELLFLGLQLRGLRWSFRLMKKGFYSFVFWGLVKR